MSGPEPSRPDRRRQLPTGLLVIGGSVLASFIWWLSIPKRPAEPPPAETPPPVAENAPPVEPAPAAPTPAPAKPAVRPERPPAPTPPPAAETAPPTVAAGPLLRVTGDIVGADVFVDRQFVGKTPLESRDVSAGPHQISISADGYDGVSRRVEIRPDAPTEITFAMKVVSLDAAVSVVHKHRLGSCEGRLAATPGGLRYTPVSGDDAFSAPLDTLLRFSVEYEEKELRIRLKNGRSYNFTTKAPTADPLLVFHRDVEKARARLAGKT